MVLHCKNKKCKTDLCDMRPHDGRLWIVCSECDEPNEFTITTSLDDLKYSHDPNLFYMGAK